MAVVQESTESVEVETVEGEAIQDCLDGIPERWENGSLVEVSVPGDDDDGLCGVVIEAYIDNTYPNVGPMQCYLVCLVNQTSVRELPFTADQLKLLEGPK